MSRLSTAPHNNKHNICLKNIFQMLLLSLVAALEESGGPSPNLFGISFGSGDEEADQGELTITLKGASDEDLRALHRLTNIGLYHQPSKTSSTSTMTKYWVQVGQSAKGGISQGSGRYDPCARVRLPRGRWSYWVSERERGWFPGRECA